MDEISLIVEIDDRQLKVWLAKHLGVQSVRFASIEDARVAIKMFIRESSPDPGSEACVVQIEKAPIYTDVYHPGYAVTIRGEGQGFLEAHRALSSLPRPHSR